MRVAGIRSGGQSGVDRAALDAAIRRGIPYDGWCPKGGWAEDCPTPPGLLARYPRLLETPSAEPRQRTLWNVRDADATLILVRGDALALSPGTALTREAAELIYLRPVLLLDLDNKDAATAARRWLRATAAALGVEAPCLNIAGPRESEVPGIYAAALGFLEGLFER